MSAWLSSLKPGDKVAVVSHFYGSHLSTVERVTAHRIVVGKSRYRKNSGVECGDSTYSKRRLVDPSEAWVVKELEIERRKRLRSEIAKVMHNCEDTATLQSALAMLQEKAIAKAVPQ